MYCLWGICFQLCQWLLFMAAGWTLPLPFADHWTGGSNSVRMLKCCRIFFVYDLDPDASFQSWGKHH